MLSLPVFPLFWQKYFLPWQKPNPVPALGTPGVCPAAYSIATPLSNKSNSVCMIYKLLVLIYIKPRVSAALVSMAKGHGTTNVPQAQTIRLSLQQPVILGTRSINVLLAQHANHSPADGKILPPN